MSRSSLCLIEEKPPQGQLRACSTEKGFSQSQLTGKFDGRHPYLRQRASRKAPLWKANLCSAIGRVDSQLEEPFSLAAVRALCMAFRSLSANSDAVCVSSCRRVFRTSVLAFCCKLLTSVEQVGDCCRIRTVRGAVTIVDVLYWWAVWVVGLVIPRPPMLTGRAMSSCSASLNAF